MVGRSNKGNKGKCQFGANSKHTGLQPHIKSRMKKNFKSICNNHWQISSDEGNLKQYFSSVLIVVRATIRCEFNYLHKISRSFSSVYFLVWLLWGAFFGLVAMRGNHLSFPLFTRTPLLRSICLMSWNIYFIYQSFVQRETFEIYIQ